MAGISDPMHVVITGGTGFLGRALIPRLVSRGERVTVLTRDARRAQATLPAGVDALAWGAGAGSAWREAIGSADAVLNLAGEPVMTQRWTADAKKRIRDSRVEGTRAVVDALASAPGRPRVLASSSGIDFYGDTGETEVDESSPAGDTFLARVCVEWEAEAMRAQSSETRVVTLRTGVVLGESGGALAQMITPFKLFVGGPIGTGRQWFPWIHLEDTLRAVEFVLTRETVRGPVNLVAPAAARMRDVSRALGQAMGRPSWAPVPRFALRIALGEAADMLVESKRVRPGVLLREGFTFEHPELFAAMRSAVH